MLSSRWICARHASFLKSSEHSDAVLKAAATAMRHSSKTQASHAYSKGGQHNKNIEAAARVALDYAARFSAAASVGDERTRPSAIK